MPGQFRVGTSGWSYQHWREIFYPKGLKSTDWLAFYAQHFDTVEINSTFYHLPRESAVQNWYACTPQNFMFALKLSRFITHRKKLKNLGDALERFDARIRPLREKIGPVLIQLPPNMAFDAAAAEAFFRQVKSQWPDFRFAVEPRHESWFAQPALALYRKFQVALCMADSGHRFPETSILTANFVYLRFHGRNGLYSADYSQAQLLPFAEKIAGWLENSLDVYAYFNNDIAGYAVKNAKLLRELVEAARSKI